MSLQAKGKIFLSASSFFPICKSTWNGNPDLQNRKGNMGSQNDPLIESHVIYLQIKFFKTVLFAPHVETSVKSRMMVCITWKRFLVRTSGVYLFQNACYCSIMFKLVIMYIKLKFYWTALVMQQSLFQVSYIKKT